MKSVDFGYNCTLSKAGREGTESPRYRQEKNIPKIFTPLPHKPTVQQLLTKQTQGPSRECNPGQLPKNWWWFQPLIAEEESLDVFCFRCLLMKLPSMDSPKHLVLQ